MFKLGIMSAVLVFVFYGSGCSVIMAMHGKKDSDLSVLTLGQDRSTILTALGKPRSTEVTADGHKADIFKLQKGNAPSGGRAFFNLLMDVLSLGFWELAATPGEAKSSQELTIKIEYDKNDKFLHMLEESTNTGNFQ